MQAGRQACWQGGRLVGRQGNRQKVQKTDRQEVRSGESSSHKGTQTKHWKSFTYFWLTRPINYRVYCKKNIIRRAGEPEILNNVKNLHFSESKLGQGFKNKIMLTTIKGVDFFQNLVIILSQIFLSKALGPWKSLDFWLLKNALNHPTTNQSWPKSKLNGWNYQLWLLIKNGLLLNRNFAIIYLVFLGYLLKTENSKGFELCKTQIHHDP